MNSEGGKDLVMIAGPNGAGKSTVASFLIKHQSISAFLNADIIASGINTGVGESDIQAGRIMLESLWNAISLGRSLAFESTMSGRIWQRLIDQAHSEGYETTLCYIAVRDPDTAVARVKQRVASGGHYIPEGTVRRRYARSLSSFFNAYSKTVHNWYFFDNSGDRAILLAMKTLGEAAPKIFYQDIFDDYARRNP